jgi:phage terminase large subunit-like protein
VTQLTAALLLMGSALTQRPADRYSLLPLQHEYVYSQARYRCFRAGNQTVFKTTAGAEDMYQHAHGTHLTRQKWCRTPGEYWVVCATAAQSVVIQEKFLEACDRAHLHPDTRLEPDGSLPPDGFRGKQPFVRIAHVAGGWSIVRFKTVEQGKRGGAALASATLHGVWVDEPLPSIRIYTELSKRVEKFGWLSVTMTPVNHPVEWFREIVEADVSVWHNIQRELTPREFIPVGLTRPILVMDDEGRYREAGQWYIDALSAKCHPSEVGIVVHGEWDYRAVDRYFTHWTDQRGYPPAEDLWTGVGFDHGSAPGKQCGVLIQVQDRGPYEYPRVWVLDEWTDPLGDHTDRADAAATLKMLDEHGLQWGHLNDACGDRELTWSTAAAKKSNSALHRQIRQQLGKRRVHPPIRTAKKGKGRGAGSADIRAKFVHHLTVEELLTISPRCATLLQAMSEWDGTARHPAKDVLDAMFYALDSWTYRARKRRSVPIRVR